MTMPCRYFAFILFFSNVIFCEGLGNLKTKKIEKLKQEIGLKTTADFDNYAYNILVEKLDSLGIKDEQLKDGFDWGGRQAGFETYIINNIDTLLSLFVKIEDIVIDKNASMKQEDSIKVSKEVEMPQISQAVDNLSIKKATLIKFTVKTKVKRLKIQNQEKVFSLD